MWRGGERSRWRGWGSWATWSLAVSPLVIFGLVPLIVLAVKAAREGSTATLASAATWSLLGRSLALSAIVAGLAGLLGVAAGYALATTRWPGRSIARVLLVGPLVLPPYIHAIGWTTLLRPGGAAVGWIAAVIGASPANIADSVYSFGGAVLVLALALFPVPMLFVHAALVSTPHSLVEAAQNMGAGPWRVFLAARWPFILPAAASSMLIVFLLASADLGVPTILKVPVFNFEVFTQLGAFNDVAAATMLAAPLIAAGLVAVVLERRVVWNRSYQADERDDVSGDIPRTSRHATGLTVCLAVLLIIVSLVLPLGAIVAEGCRWEAIVRAASIAVRPALNTVLYAACAATAITMIGLALSWMLRGRGRRKRALTDALLVLGFATPGSILALGLLAAYDRPGVSAMAPASMLVVAALVVRLVIVGQRVVSAGVGAIPDTLIEAAQLAGASGPRTIRSIVLPLVVPHLAAAVVVTFVLAAAEIGSTILLYPPGGETLPIALYSVEANSPRALVAAMTLILAALPLATVTFAAFTVRVIRRP